MGSSAVIDRCVDRPTACDIRAHIIYKWSDVRMAAFDLRSARWPVIALAILFGSASIAFSVIWMYHIRVRPPAFLGADYEYLGPAAGVRITSVGRGTPAERAGIKVGDRIVAVNGQSVTTRARIYDGITRAKPGDRPLLTVIRDGQPAPIALQPTLTATQVRPLTMPRRLVREITGAYPLLWLIVGLTVLFQRLYDRNAWLLALIFAGFIASAPLYEAQLPPRLRSFEVAYQVVFQSLFPALFYFFFAVFPIQSPIDRRFPTLKWLGIGVALAVAMPLANVIFVARGFEPLTLIARRATSFAWLDASYSAIFVALGLTSLVWNRIRSPTADARRKINVMVWGTVLGTTPGFILTYASLHFNRPFESWPFWIWTSAVIALLLVPLSIAYAVIKHRVLEIPVLLKRSARYLLVQRGFVIIILVVSIAATFQFALLFDRAALGGAEVAVPVGAAFGVLLAWVGTRSRHHVTRRLDRAFFRSAYDARRILEDLANTTRTATDREALAVLLERHLSDALHPVFLDLYLDQRDGELRRVREGPTRGPDSIALNEAWMQPVVLQEQPWDVQEQMRGEHAAAVIPPAGAECLVPILSRDGAPLGLIVLGPKLSEEPYSGEDKRLLASIASQTGIALENISLAERIAERMEAARRVAHEIEIAREVQQKLFPQKLPPVRTLDYGGMCLQARVVGGDYYDFLDLGHGRVGLVLADISGKGIAAALLMANLQANLRSQYALAIDDLPRLLSSVNRLFYESTAPNRFATLFFATYDNDRLTYANCGHNPPLLLRGNGELRWLAPTAPVLGLFEEWTCVIDEVQLHDRDTLIMFTDGITEATSDSGAEYGEARLLETARRHPDASASALISAIVEDVRAFASQEQSDDLTLVVARRIS
jgi:phosphoserine phosphatase RsbU/P